MYEIDESQIRLCWSVFNPDNKLVEIRLLGKSTYSGYFKDVNVLVERLRPMLDDKCAQYYGNLQAYFTLNEIKDELYSREQRDMFVKSPKSTTNDGDVSRRRFIMLDFDPCRVAGVSASDEEFEKSHMKAIEVYRYLMDQGFNEPIITKSGNGFHEYLPCDMPADDAHTDLVKRFLKSLGKMFSDKDVEIDEKVYNNARVDKLVGTWAKKGSDSKDRPWRIATLVKVPKDLSPNDESLFQKIADLLPKEEPKPTPTRKPYTGTTQSFDLVSWLNAHGIVYKVETQGTDTKYALEHCPWEDTHSTKQKYDSALFVDADGKIKFNCFHSHCKDKTWQDFRLFYEPDAYDRPAYQPQPLVVRQPFIPQRPKYEIKDVVPELGEKWLSMSSIKKIDISALEHYKTGFTELDRHILGLFMGEVTLLSGSNSSGKTSWLNSLILNLIDQGAPTALWSGELPAPILKSWISMVAAGKRNLSPSQYNDGKFFVPNNVSEKIDQWLDGRLFIYNNDYGNNWKQLFHDMELLVKCGVKFFVLDNLFSMNIDLLGTDNNSRQKELILQIKEFAKKNQVHIILVAHPRKTMAFLRKNDISGTSDLGNAVDDIFIIHRVNNDFFRAGADFFGKTEINRFQGFGNVIEVAKNRMFGAVDLMVGMHYEIESRRFKNAEYEDKQYGWERMEYEQTEIDAPTSYYEPQRESAVFKEDAPIDNGVPFAPPAMDDDPPF